LLNLLLDVLVLLRCVRFLRFRLRRGFLLCRHCHNSLPTPTWRPLSALRRVLSRSSALSVLAEKTVVPRAGRSGEKRDGRVRPVRAQTQPEFQKCRSPSAITQHSKKNLASLWPHGERELGALADLTACPPTMYCVPPPAFRRLGREQQ